MAPSGEADWGLSGEGLSTQASGAVRGPESQAGGPRQERQWWVWHGGGLRQGRAGPGSQEGVGSSEGQVWE